MGAPVASLPPLAASDNSGNVDNLLSMMCNAATDSVATRQQQQQQQNVDDDDDEKERSRGVVGE